MNLGVGVIMGLNEDPNGPLLGLRAFLNGIGIDPITAAWNQPKTIMNVVDSMTQFGHYLLVGHSHGGHRAIEICDGHWGAVPPIAWCIALDPKPPMWEHLGDFLDPNYTYPIPRFSAYNVSFCGGFGCNFADTPFTLNLTDADPLVLPADKSTLNVAMSEPYRGILGHPKIPSSPVVQSFIAARIKELQAI